MIRATDERAAMPQDKRPVLKGIWVGAAHRRLKEAHDESLSKTESWLAERFNISSEVARACVHEALKRTAHAARPRPSRKSLRVLRESNPLWENAVRVWEDSHGA